MPQPTVNQVHISAALSNIAVAFLQSDDNYIADKIFPNVPVQHQTDKYFVYRKDDFFRDEAQERADATESAGSGFNLDTKSYLANVYALHKDIGDQTRRNADPAIDIDAATTRFLMQKLLIKRDRIFVSNYMKTGVWDTDITGVASNPTGTQVYQWSDDANSDPFTDIANGQTTVLQNTGYEANTLVLGWPVYQALRKHPLVIDRIKFTMQADAKNITPELLAAAFDVERVVVAKATYNSAAEGLTGSYSFIVGKTALLCYSASAPGLMLPSAGYTFGWSGYSGINQLGVATYDIPMPWLGKNTNRVECEMAFDMEVVASSMGYYFTSIVA
jgi:hypothetical protein